MPDIRQTSKYANYLSKIGWTVEKIDNTNIFIRKFSIFGSALKIQRSERLDLEKLEKLAKKYRAFQIIIEPKNQYIVSSILYRGFKISKNPYLPTKTLELDLTQSEKKLFGRLKKDCRRAIRKNQDLRLMIYDLRDIDKFREAWKKAVGLKRYVPPLSHLEHLKNAFKDNALFITTENGESGAIFLNAHKKAYYWQAFTNKIGRKKLYQYKILWEGILWSKRHGANIFDFEGIYDERFPNKSWLGFTHFKKSFGGKEKEYPGCFVKNRLPFEL